MHDAVPFVVCRASESQLMNNYVGNCYTHNEYPYNHLFVL